MFTFPPNNSPCISQASHTVRWLLRVKFPGNGATQSIFRHRHSLISVDITKPGQFLSWATCCSWSCLRRGTGVKVKRTYPILAILILSLEADVTCSDETESVSFRKFGKCFKEQSQVASKIFPRNGFKAPLIWNQTSLCSALLKVPVLLSTVLLKDKLLSIAQSI